jgi:hypothetical protein
MLDQSSLISIASAIAIVAVNYGIIRSDSRNTKESLTDFKADIKKSLTDSKTDIKESLNIFRSDLREEIVKEKRHAMEVANLRIEPISKDVDEIWPRLRTVEESSNKNCYALTTMQKNCLKHQREGG